MRWNSDVVDFVEDHVEGTDVLLESRKDGGGVAEDVDTF